MHNELITNATRKRCDYCEENDEMRWKALNSNWLPTRWAFERWWWLVVVGVLFCEETVAAVFIARVNQFLHLYSFQALHPSIECDAIQLRPWAVSGEWRARKKVCPYACLAHDFDVTYNTMRGTTSDDRHAGQLAEVPGYMKLVRERDIQEFQLALIGWFVGCMAILSEAAFVIPPFAT
jgi:hypothetical protein